MSGWRYYNHAMLPAAAPDTPPDLTLIENGDIWKIKEKPLLARWTTDFDCGYETEWWYCIKDSPLDVSGLSSKRRYDIKKGKKYFDVERISPELYVQEIFRVQQEAFCEYPKEYRPHVFYDKVEAEIRGWKSCDVFAAFDKETRKFSGYSVFENRGRAIEWMIMKTLPEFEKLNINAALAAGSIEYYQDELNQGAFIVDGERNISHKTNFQDYLIKQFGFRRAYCRLHIAYRPDIKKIIWLCYPFRKVLKRRKGPLIHRINALLLMEEIFRCQDTKGEP